MSKLIISAYVASTGHPVESCGWGSPSGFVMEDRWCHIFAACKDAQGTKYIWFDFDSWLWTPANQDWQINASSKWILWSAGKDASCWSYLVLLVIPVTCSTCSLFLYVIKITKVCVRVCVLEMKEQEQQQGVTLDGRGNREEGKMAATGE